MRITIKHFLITLILVTSIKAVTAQNNVGIGTLAPSNSAMLDIVASDKGLLIPRVALTSVNTPINAPATGLMVYNTSTSGTYSTPGFYYFDGSNWVQIGSGGGTGPAGPMGPTGPTGPAGPTSIQSLTLSGNDLTISGANTVTLPTSGGSTTYTAGTGISITGNTIANTLPNTIQTLTLNVSTLTLSGGGGSVVLPSGGGTLDNAYDFGGAGAGRTITADAGSVTINGSGTGLAGIALMVNQSGTGTAAIGAQLTGAATGNAINAANLNAANINATIQATTNSGTATNSAILGESSSGASRGVTGQVAAASTGGAGVFGSNARTNGGFGVQGSGFNGTIGEATNIQGYGVFGQNGPPNATYDAIGVGGLGGVGVYGQTNSSGVYAGVLAENLTTMAVTTPGTQTFGLLATANGGNGVLGQTLNQYGVGVVGTNFSTGLSGNCLGVYGNSTFIGVAGETSDLMNGYGVYAEGDLGASGTKSFVIDHPLDPTNKLLKHFSIESDEVLNVYRGTIVLDTNGDATVELPTYFKEININFSYQLTAIGSAAPNIFVKEEIVGNTFKISGGNANQKISWTVYAERNDLVLQKYPQKRNTEVEKRPVDKGTYQHPELYGLPKKEQKQVKTNGQKAGKQLELTK